MIAVCWANIGNCGIVVILRDNKKAYSRHPQILRWAGFGWALRQRHRLLREIQSLSRAHHITGLPSATALTELAAWLD